MRYLQKFIEWNRSSGRQYIKPGFESIVLDHIQRYTALPAAQADGGRIIGSRTIDGVHVIVVSPFSRLLDEQLFVRYDDYFAAAQAVVLLRRAIPYLRDEGSKYDDDGSNEPLELAREIKSLIDQQAGSPKTVKPKLDTPQQAIDLDAVRECLGKIADLSTALRHGGPAPEDLHGLSDALEEAISIAYDMCKIIDQQAGKEVA